ncbi:MAG: major capsid protein [Gallicola sp.]|nr:major capsid protein [Gallicola sp.]
MEIEELLKKFSVETMTSISNQIKTSPSFILDRFYTKKEAVLGTSAEVIIKRGAGVLLESVSNDAEHLMTKTDDAYILNIPLPRFPLVDNITASDMATLRSLNSSKAIAETLAVKIGEKLAKQKRDIITTMEFMAVGSLFGVITDGKGKELFKFTSRKESIKLDKTSATGKKNIETSLSEITRAIIAEFGTTQGFEIFCGYDFISTLAKKADEEDLFNKGARAAWKNSGDTRTLSILGVDFTPYEAIYKDAKGKDKSFLDSDKAIVVPKNLDAFTHYYARAIHVEALGRSPELFFSASPERLAKGQGYAIITESRNIPICNRPDAILHLEFKD